jgi:hypothetical protein
MYPVNGTINLNGTDTLEECRFFRSSVNDKALIWYSLFNGVTDSEEEAFLDLFPFLWSLVPIL